MRPRTIILEDDDHLRRLLSVLLENRGHEVRAYADPVTCPLFRDTVCSCPQTDPCGDILITDMQMPNMTGLEFLRRQQARGCKLRASNKLVLSAHLTPAQEQEARQLGCTVMKKPYKIGELLSWIKSCEERVEEGRRLGPVRLYPREAAGA